MIHVLSSGRTLGGSSALNFFAYCKPPAQEIDGTLELPMLSFLRSYSAIGFRLFTLQLPYSCCNCYRAWNVDRRLSLLLQRCTRLVADAVLRCQTSNGLGTRDGTGQTSRSIPQRQKGVSSPFSSLPLSDHCTRHVDTASHDIAY